MLSFLNQRLIAFAKAAAQPVRCEGCGKTFKPFADQEISSLGDLMGGATCPQCGKQVEVAGGRAARREDHLAPEGPLPQPAGSRIELHEVSASERLYHIPAAGKGGFLLVFAILWNGFLLFFASIWLFAAEVEPKGEPTWPMALFMVPFVAVGLGVGYAGVRAKYAVHLLFVGPEFMRLQRQLLGRKKNYDLPTQEVTGVEQKEFYQQNYQPVYGIEIVAGGKKIRFGSALSEEEKRWLCAEIREYLRTTGNPNFTSDTPPTPSAEQSNAASTSLDLRSVAAALPLSRAAVESVDHDTLVIQIPPSGRWGAFLPIALILTVTIIAGFILLFTDLVPAFDTFRRLSSGAEILFGMGMLLTAGFAALAWYGVLRHRYLRQQISADRHEVQLETHVFGRMKSRSLPIREVTRVDLLEIMKINGNPRHAVRVVSPRQSFWFGSTLPEEDKSAVASLLREFLRRQGAPIH